MQTVTVRGVNELKGGWVGILAGVFAWYANPFWAFGLLFGFGRRPDLAASFGLVSVAIACTVFFNLVGRELPDDEGWVHTERTIRLLPGCYVWLASLAAIPLAAMMECLVRTASAPRL